MDAASTRHNDFEKTIQLMMNQFQDSISATLATISQRITDAATQTDQQLTAIRD